MNDVHQYIEKQIEKIKPIMKQEMLEASIKKRQTTANTCPEKVKIFYTYKKEGQTKHAK